MLNEFCLINMNGRVYDPVLGRFLNPADSVDELRDGIEKSIDYYNYNRPHQSLVKMLPAMEYGIVA